MSIVALNKLIDLGNEIRDTTEAAAPDRSLGNDVEPDLHLVEPWGIGRCVVDVLARTRRKPSADLSVFVGGVVINH